MPDTVVEVRCPVGPRRLFTRLQLGQESARYLAPGNLIEFTCGDCARRLSRQLGRRVRVLHRFNFLGELIDTAVVTPAPPGGPAPPG